MTKLDRLTPDNLRVGGRYLHYNGDFVRTIDSIEGDTIHWHDQYGPGVCSTKAFLKVCRSAVVNDDGNDGPGSGIGSFTEQQDDTFTIRDESNALTAYAFRNGFLEDLHAGKDSPLLLDPGFSRITDDEMRRLMVEASEKLAEMLRLKQDDPVAYEAWLRNYHRRFCQNWKRE